MKPRMKEDRCQKAAPLYWCERKMAHIKTNKPETIKILNIKTFFCGRAGLFFFNGGKDNVIRMIQILPKYGFKKKILRDKSRAGQN